MNKDASLKITYMLLTANKPLSTNEIAEHTGTERKTIYKIIDRLEDAGFCTEVIKEKGKPNYYTCRLSALN